MSELADRANVESRAAADCGSPASTHYDGCPCSLLRMDDLIADLRALVEHTAIQEYGIGYDQAVDDEREARYWERP